MNNKENPVIQKVSSVCTNSSCHDLGICQYSEKVSVILEKEKTQTLNKKTASAQISTETQKARSVKCGNIKIVYREAFSQLRMARTTMGTFLHREPERLSDRAYKRNK